MTAARVAADDALTATGRAVQPSLTAREDAAARLHAAVLDRLAREGIPIPPEPLDDLP